MDQTEGQQRPQESFVVTPGNDTRTQHTPDAYHAGAEDAYALYARMRPDQRTAIGNEFVRMLALAGDPEITRFSTEARAREEERRRAALGNVEAIPPRMQPPEVVAELHRYVQAQHPELFEQVMRHPVTVAAMAAPGAEPEPETAEEAGLPPLEPEDDKTLQAEAAGVDDGAWNADDVTGHTPPDGTARITQPDAPDALMESTRESDERPMVQ